MDQRNGGPKERGLLKGVSIFADLDAPAVAALERLADVREFPDGGVVVSQEDTGDALFVLVRGKVKVVLYGDSGREIILSIFKRCASSPSFRGACAAPTP